MVLYEIRNGSLQPLSGSVQVSDQGAIIKGGSGNVLPNPVPGVYSDYLKDFLDAIDSFEQSGGTLAPKWAGVADKLNKLDDISSVISNIAASRQLEATMKSAGIYTGGIGATLGLGIGKFFIDFFKTIPKLRLPILASGAFFGNKFGSNLGENLVYDTYVRNTAPTLANSLNLEPSVVLNGEKYFIVTTDTNAGIPLTFVYHENTNSTIPGRYNPVTVTDIYNQVLDQAINQAGLDPKILSQQWNVINGLSTTGYAVNTTHYEVNSQFTFRVRVYKDQNTNSIEKLGSGLSKTHKIEIPSNHRNNATRSCKNAFCSTLTLT